MELPAEELLQRVARVLDGALLRVREERVEVAAVAVTTFWHNLLGVAADGSPLTPLLSWGDTRAAATAVRLDARLDAAAMHLRTGCFLHPSYPAVKLAWLRERDPAAFARVAGWVSFAEYLEGRLFGERRCSLSMASGSGLLDLHRLRWDEEALEAAGITPAHLSPLADVDAPLRGLRPEFARRWPELADLPWFPALGDGACANLGAGAVGLDRRGLTVGTTAALRTLWEPAGALRVPEELWCYRLDARRCVAGGALSNGGNAVAWLRQTLQLPPPEAEDEGWEEALGALEPDAHGLTILPFLLGERGPRWREESRAVVVGLTQGTPALHLLRGWLEAVAYRVARVSARLDAAYGGAARVLASGGALHASPTWAQLLADVLGQQLALSAEPEATSRGAALVAQEQLGWRAEPPGEAAETPRLFAPHPGRHARYRAAMQRQAQLERTLAPWLAATSRSPGGEETH
jgi:gluconokinase